MPYNGKEVIGVMTTVAQSRRGGAVEENKFRTSIEIQPRDKRKKSANQLISELKTQTDKLDGFSELTFQKNRWGQESGSPIEVIVQQNDDLKLHEIAEAIKSEMSASAIFMNVEIDEPLRVPEYRVRFDREKIKRLSIDPGDIASKFRAALEGTVLY